MARRTKIVATLGPATDTDRALNDLIEAGTDLVRVNFSHGSFEEHAGRIERARAAATRAGRVVGILGDLRGPKVRIERFATGKAMLVDGETFTLDPAFDPTAGTDRIVGVAYESLPRDVSRGDTLLLNDGLISLEVTGIEGTKVQTRVLTGGELSDLKGLNKLGGGLSAGALTAKDREDVRMAAELGVDYLAVSFVRDRDDISETWDLLRAAGGEGRIVAKIERREAIDNLEAIIDTSAAVMVARGDLGIEVGYAELTGLQKHIIERRACPQPPRDHGDSDDGIDDPRAGADARRSLGRRECRDGRHGCRDALSRDRRRASSRPRRARDGAGHRGCREVADDQPSGHAHGGPVQAHGRGDRRGRDVHGESPGRARHRRIDRIRLDGALDVAHPLGHPDLCLHAPRRDATARDALSRGVPVDFDVTHPRPEQMYPSIFQRLIADGLAAEGDLIIVTKGEFSGVTGGTNSMKIIQVQRPPA